MTVVDASFIIAALVDEEHTVFASSELASFGNEPLHAPALIRWEFLNALLKKLARAQIAGEELSGLLQAFELLALNHPPVPSRTEMIAVVTLARAHGLSAYDAAYLRLALRGTHLATVDRALARAGKSEGLSVISPWSFS